ncbi:MULTISPECIES: alpha/beta hydrolase [Glaesserella]|uniref:Serine hydrolase family protein n=1 Tax=Glaesserella australis TaxID=2094024 RepID=A0A328C0K0_9PAST|nr:MULTISPECIES: alpha/beta hydrolase [Glaesserella]AUI66767.1 esterase [Glaesserella sp. 15-184]RAL19819.1 serine hydrolase family protein [Glaesserella australis]
MPKVYVVHGYTASADKHWFPWLEQELAKIGIECHRLNMPDSANPNPDKWLKYLEENTVIDDETIVIGHSLGCIALLNFMARHFLKPKGAIFVSGFYQPLDTLPELNSFSNSYAVAPSCLPFKSYVVAALNDTVVPYQYSDDFAKHLKADYIRLTEGGHFLDREGWIEFSLILDLVKKLLS